jgi:hypothetical protein
MSNSTDMYIRYMSNSTDMYISYMSNSTDMYISYMSNSTDIYIYICSIILLINREKKNDATLTSPAQSNTLSVSRQLAKTRNGLER